MSEHILTSLAIATFAFKTFHPRWHPTTQPLEYLNGDDYKILWEKEGLGMEQDMLYVCKELPGLNGTESASFCCC